MRVCLPFPVSGTFRNQWDYALSHIDADVFVIGDRADAPTHGRLALDKATWIDSAAELPDAPLVVLAPANGRYVQGVTSLDEFDHPSDAIYLFGPDGWHLSDVELGERTPDHAVFIPTDTPDEMYSFVAFAVVAWDLRLRGVS